MIWAVCTQKLVSVIGWVEKYYEYKFFSFFTYVILIVKQKPGREGYTSTYWRNINNFIKVLTDAHTTLSENNFTYSYTAA